MYLVHTNDRFPEVVVFPHSINSGSSIIVIRTKIDTAMQNQLENTAGLQYFSHILPFEFDK